MMIKQALIWGSNALESVSLNGNHAWIDGEILLSHAVKKPRTWIIAHSDATLTKRQWYCFGALIRRRAKDEPLPYILKSANFYGRDFFVDRSVLIPRVESEDIIELVKKEKPKGRDSILVDIGTGSGALAITMKKEFPSCQVIASDISSRALSVARRNANKLKATIMFEKASLWSDKLTNLIESKKPTQLIITANLPYLPNADKKRLSKSVINYEPHDALFAGKTGNELILKLFKQIHDWKKTQPKLALSLFIECDPPQAKTLFGAARKIFPESRINIHIDKCDRPRMISIN